MMFFSKPPPLPFLLIRLWSRPRAMSYPLFFVDMPFPPESRITLLPTPHLKAVVSETLAFLSGRVLPQSPRGEPSC